MRASLIVIVLLTSILCPLAGHASADSGDLTIVSQQEFVIYEEHEIQAWITLNNRGTEQRSFTIPEPNNLPNGIISNSFPISFSLTAGEVLKLYYGLESNQSVTKGTYWYDLEIIEDGDSVVHDYSQMITVAEESNLEFGVSGISNFIVQPNTRTSLAVNITNIADFDDNVTFSLWSQSTWNYGWTMNNSSNGLAYQTISPNELTYVYFFVDIPGVIDGFPLYGQGPRFELKAVSGLDRKEATWSFDLSMDEFSNMTIDYVQELLPINPGESSRLRVDIRNTGNIPTLPNMNLEIINENGQINTELGALDRHIVDDWTVGIFGGLEFQTLEPNESRSIEIGFQAPNLNEGGLSVRLNLQPGNQYWKKVSTDVKSEIVWSRSATMSIVSSNCEQIIVNEECTIELTIKNTGNYFDDFSLDASNFPPWSEIEFSESRLFLEQGESTSVTVNLSSNEPLLPAFTQGEITFNLLQGESEISLGTLSTPLKIDPYVEWIFEDVVEEVDARGRLSISMTLRNEGNVIDGLLVDLESSHSTNMGFIPPEGAIFEEGIENIRYFEINDIAIGSNFTLRAYADLPANQNSNGTLFLNTSVRSKYVPSIEFVQTSQSDFLGVQWRENGNEPFIDLQAVFSNVIEIAKGWWFFTCLVIASILLIRKGVKDRKLRNEQNDAMAKLHQPKEVSTDPNDWLSGFQRNEKVVIEQENNSKFASTDEYRRHFSAKSSKTSETLPVSEEVQSAAKTVIDHHSDVINQNKLNLLASEIQQGNVARPHEGNTSLEPASSITERVIRNDPKQIMQEKPQVAKNIPLPKDDDLRMIDLDDIDL